MRILMPIACSAALCGIVAPAAMAQDFYAGKTVQFIIGFSVNNGYDLYSRMTARHIAKHLPGRPNVVPQNMPGAGSLAAINHLYNVAPKDGTILGMIDQAAPLTQLFDSSSLKADVSKLNWIGRITDNAAVLYGWHTAPVQKIQQASSMELIIAAPGQNSRMLSTFLKNALDLKLKVLTGYKGASESQLAMERGEVHALTQPYSVLRAEKPDWIRDKKITLLMQVGVDGHPDLKDVPLVTDLARNDDERRMVELMAGNSRIGRSVTSPPNQPAERVSDLRRGFSLTMKDPEFLAEIKRLDLDLNPMSGEELQQVIVDSLNVPPSLVARARELAETVQ